ncbi:MAG: PAS domain-containing protein, partial [Lachnospiraceae bacterium]|nr:PAS domain-containing protein [Lachnospiraceae bacterium]
MDTKRIESFKQFAQYLEYPMVVFEAESGHVLEINYEAEVLLGSPVENIQIEPGRAFTKLNFWELLHGKKSLMWHRIRMMADDREFLVSGLVNEAVVEDKTIYTLLFERRADLNIGSLTLDRIVDHAGLVAIYLSKNETGYQVEYVSRNVNQYGYTRAQFYEKLLSIAEVICAEDRDAVQAVIAKDTMTHVQENTLECRVVTEERELIPVRLLIHYIYNDYGISTDYEILVVDLREEYRRSSENRYLSLAVSKMKNVVLIKSYKGNRRTLKYISPNAGMVGMNVEALQNGYKLTEDYIYPEDRDAVIDAIYQAIESGVTDYVQRYRMVRDDGKKIWVDNVVTVTRISDGEAEISFLLTDITEQKEMEEELAETLQLSEAPKKTEKEYETDSADIDPKGKELAQQLELMAETLSRDADYYTVVLDANGKILTNPSGPASDLGQFYDIFERPSFKERFEKLSVQAKEEMVPQSISFDMDAFVAHMVLAPLI